MSEAEVTENKVKALMAEVSSRITAAGGEPRNRVVEALVEREISRRATMLDTAVQLWSQLSEDLSKLKPDQVQIDPDTGEKLSETMSHKAYDALKKQRDKLAKLEKAMTNAMEGDFKQLEDMLKKLGK